MSNRRYLYLFVIFLFVIFIAANFTFANECSTGKCNSPGPHCGLYCLYSAMKLSGKEIEFKELLKPEYIGSSKGSSLAELKKAAIDNGLEAVVVGRLSGTELKSSPYPMILHTKSEQTDKEYNHYVLYLGTESGKAKIFDPPNPVALMSFAQLAPMWDGNALVVANEPINLNKIFWPGRLMLIIYSAVAIIFIILTRFASKKWLKKIQLTKTAKFGISIAQAAAFAIAALMAGFTYHFADSDGFLAHADGVSSVRKAHMASFIPKIDKEHTAKAMNDKNVLIVDARMSEDYQQGHIDGAVNIPVTLCDAGRAGIMNGIDKNKTIVLYCQSSGCGYAEDIAAKLIGDGYENVSIYKAGWVDWDSKDNGDKK